MISLTFEKLSTAQAQALLDAYAAVQDEQPQASAPVAQPQPQASAPVAQPQPQASAPVSAPVPAPVVQAQASATDDTLDIDGVPYNPELHSVRTTDSGGKTAEGRWKCRRGGNRTAYEEWAKRYAVTTPRAAVNGTGNPFTIAPTPAPEYEPTEQEVIAKATAMSQAGILTAAEVQRIMAVAGTTDNVALVRNPDYRRIAWAELQKLERQAA